MSTELPDKAPSYARPYRDPRSTGCGYPAEDPKYAHDGPDEPNWPQWRWDEWHASRAESEAAFDRDIARSLAKLTPEQQEYVLSRMPDDQRRNYERLMEADVV
jgi:hypothetical protein